MITNVLPSMELMMPKGTKVHDMYDAMVAEGMAKGKAARIAQAKTGLALATGRPPSKGTSKTKGKTRTIKRNY
jgi:hypothetical protein